MPNLKEVRNRITSVNSTRQITSAMKLVSAAKLRRAQDAITNMRPYAEKLSEVMGNLSQAAEGSDSPYMEQREVEHITLVLVTSNRGLCGAFNAQIIRRAKALVSTTYADYAKSGKLSLVTVGKKASSWAAQSGLNHEASYDELYTDLSFPNVVPAAESLMQQFASGETDKVVLLYNRFVTAAAQLVTEEQMLPVMPPQSNEAKGNGVEYIYEPDKASILENLIPISLKTQFFKVLLDSHASEHGARMTAMHKATDNAGELLKSLKLSYNKARQAAITNEILEIVAGAEALEN